MRFSLTGDQSDAALLIQSIVTSADHSLEHVHLHGPLAAELQTKLPVDTRRAASPEEVFVGTAADTVIVAHSQADESVRLARHASQAEHHVIVIPPGDLSTAYSYELHLVLDESHCGIIVLTGSWYQSQDFRTDIRFTDFRLNLPSPQDDIDASGTLMHVIDACSAFGFANSQVTALGTKDDGSLVSGSQIMLAGSAADGTPRPPVRLKFSGADPLGRLQGHVDGQVVDQPVILPGRSDYRTSLLCERLAESLPDTAACQAGMEQFSRTLQVVSAIERSVRRRRTIDVYVDELTERSVFKTQMTAIGCGVLTWLMTGMIGYLLLGQLFKPPDFVMQFMRAAWIAPVVIFLLSQLLLPIARRRKQDEMVSGDDRDTVQNETDSDPHSV
ncbi:MAG: DUF2798 domain-containing protein [Fuerstiella sp.]|nr:DUF2798 domain-containing protein [Fuerstiella sp.]